MKNEIIVYSEAAEVGMMIVVTSRFHSLTLVFGEQTAQAGENACLQQLRISTLLGLEAMVDER